MTPLKENHLKELFLSNPKLLQTVFRCYRVALFCTLIALYIFDQSGGWLGGNRTNLFFLISVGWLLVVLSSFFFDKRISSTVTTSYFVADMLVLAYLGWITGGVSSGIYFLMIPSAAMAGLMLPRRLSLFIAAISAIAILYAQMMSVLDERDKNLSNFVNTGMLGAVIFFATMLFNYLEKTITSAEKRTRSAREGQKELKKMLEAVVSPAVAERLLETGIELGGEEREVTIMFTDIRNFTQMANASTPNKTLNFLNGYFEVVTQEIEAHGGVVDKYIGDSVMAIFGAPVYYPDHSSRAVSAALAIHKALRKFNRSRKVDIRTGIGIHTGRVTMGNIGCSFRLNYTAIGDGVNLASRIEGLTKKFGVPILVSAATARAAPEFRFVEIDEVQVKGRSNIEKIYLPFKRGDKSTPAIKGLDLVE